MRFNVLLAVTFIATSAAGLVIPSNNFVEARDLDFLDDATVVRREPTRDSRHPEASRQHRQTTGLPPRRSTFHVPAAPSTGRPARKSAGKIIIWSCADPSIILQTPTLDMMSARLSSMATWNTSALRELATGRRNCRRSSHSATDCTSLRTLEDLLDLFPT